MKTEKYYTDEELNKMTVNELGELVKNQQIQLQSLRWSLNDVKELLITALQSLPKTIKL